MKMLEFKNISFGYNPKEHLLEDVSFSLQKGSITTLLGPNGVGKTTLLKIVLHILKPLGGEIFLDEKPIRHISRKHQAQTVAYVPQTSYPLFSITVLDLVLLGRAPYGGQMGFQTEKDREIVDRVLYETETDHLKTRHFDSLSGGEKQRVLIAKALAQTPKLLILDEPTNHLDIKHQWELIRLLKRLNREGGLTIFSVFHDLGLASELSDQMIFLKNGRIDAMGPPQDLLTADRVESVFGIPVAIDMNPFTGNRRITYR